MATIQEGSVSKGLRTNTLGEREYEGLRLYALVVRGFRDFGENPKQMVARCQFVEFVTGTFEVAIKFLKSLLINGFSGARSINWVKSLVPKSLSAANISTKEWA